MLIIDQFEELFTQCEKEDRKDFLVFLRKFLERDTLRVVVTLRAEFFPQAIQDPLLAELLRSDLGTFPLDPPGIGALYEMIVRPAQAADLELQDEVVRRILDQAGTGPGSMPLIAFTLSDQYETNREKGKNRIDIDSYEAYGGVQGAINRRAKAALTGLNNDTEKVLDELFPHLVEVNEKEIATRRIAVSSKLKGNMGTAANALMDARLLVSGKGKDDMPTLELAHEMVLEGWDTLQKWVLDRAESLRARRDLEHVAQEWNNTDRPRGLLQTGQPLKRYLGSAGPRSAIAEQYLGKCKFLRWIWRTLLVLCGFIVIVLTGLYTHISQSEYPPAFAAKAMFVNLGVWPLTPLQMIEIGPDRFNDAGEFEMGDPQGEKDELFIRTVRFPTPFEIGKFEVTFDDYDLFAAATGRTKPSDEGWGRGKRPVINVSWLDAQAYAEWVSERTALQFRLPSEAEWEYAARAGTDTQRFWPETITGQAELACEFSNVLDTRNEPTVRSLISDIYWEPFDCDDGFAFSAPAERENNRPNNWGFHDMLGNVWEWVQDCYVDSYDGARNDGIARELQGGSECNVRVQRGGSWDYGPASVRTANRGKLGPEVRVLNIGFRLARTL